MSGPDPRRARRLLMRLRVVIYAGLLVLVGYYAWRYDLVGLPREGCSPLEAFSPGTRLIVDRHGPTPVAGSAVLYRAPEGLLLGRTAAPPADLGAVEREACLAGEAFWVLKERDACPGSDSRRLGPIPAGDLHGRVAGTLPW